MLLLQCNGCGTTTTVDCACPPEMADVPAHLAECPMYDLGSNVVCPPGSGCCTLNHSHDQSANACTGEHAGQPCPAPTSCKPWQAMQRNIAGLDPANPQHAAVRAQLAHVNVDGDCPGGHCAMGVPGCLICRPITITALAGAAHLKPVHPGV